MFLVAQAPSSTVQVNFKSDPRFHLLLQQTSAEKLFRQHSIDYNYILNTPLILLYAFFWVIPRRLKFNAYIYIYILKLVTFLQLIGTIKRTVFKKVRTETILKLYNTLVLPTFLYGSENWTLTALQR
jgi:hypothetical protein